MKIAMVKRGDIYYADLSPVVGSEQGGMRPVLIVQNDTGNKHSPTVIAAAITSQTGKARLPTHIELSARSVGLNRDSVILLEQIRTIDKHRLGQRIGRLSEKHIAGINHALAISIGLIDPAPQKLTLCLCSTCVDNFFGTGAYHLKRVDPNQIEKETCTYCNQRRGYDYIVVKK